VRVVFLEVDTERSWAVASIGPQLRAVRQCGRRRPHRL